MSNNPWPFVVVALLSLGFLAKSMAQQEDNGQAYAPGSTANQDFGAHDASADPGPAPDFKVPSATDKGESELPENSWVTNEPASIPLAKDEISQETDEPFFKTRPQARFGQVTASPGSSITANTSPDYAAENAPPAARLLPASSSKAIETESVTSPARLDSTYGKYEDPFRDNRPYAGYRHNRTDSPDSRDRQPFSVAQSNPTVEQAQLGSAVEDNYFENDHNSSSVAPRDNVVQFGMPETNAPAANYRQPNLRSESPHDFALSGRSDLPPAIDETIRSNRPHPRSRRNDGQTKQTAMMAERTFMGSPPQFGDTTPSPGNQDVPPQQATNEIGGSDDEKQTGSLGLRNLFKTVSDKVTGTSDSTTGVAGENEIQANGKLPLWPTMALFASLAANLFFGWIAWDTHSKYQTFVEEISEAETDRERRSRRLRDEPRPSIAARRRSRDEDEAEFLSGGIEV